MTELLVVEGRRTLTRGKVPNLLCSLLSDRSAAGAVYAGLEGKQYCPAAEALLA